MDGLINLGAGSSGMFGQQMQLPAQAGPSRSAKPDGDEGDREGSADSQDRYVA
jgi:hypothetical protein